MTIKMLKNFESLSSAAKVNLKLTSWIAQVQPNDPSWRVFDQILVSKLGTAEIQGDKFKLAKFFKISVEQLENALNAKYFWVEGDIVKTNLFNR